MKVNSININSYSSSYIHLSGDEAAVTVRLDESDANRLKAVALEIFLSRQNGIAKSIADMKPELLPAPNVVDGDYSDVS